MKEFPKLLRDRQMAGAAIDAATVQPSRRPRLIEEREWYRGILHGFETTGKGLITAQVGDYFLIVDSGLRAKLKKSLNKNVEVARFGEKHYLRVLEENPEPPKLI